MSHFTKRPSIQEYQALQSAFSKYIKAMGIKLNAAQRVKQANDLIEKYRPIFIQNPIVKDKIQSSSLELKELLKINTNDGTNLATQRQQEDYLNPRNQIEPVKARLLIFSLEIEGYYERPLDRGENFLHTAIIEDIYRKSVGRQDGKITIMMDEDIGNGLVDKRIAQDLIGTYQLFRLSFNNSFPGYVSAQTLRVFQDEKDSNILKYQSFNSYKQYQAHDNDKGMNRIRVSSGHIYNYQQQLLFIGGTAYSHLDETEYKLTTTNKPILKKYPDIMMMHHHSGDTKNIRGIVLGQYPFLNLPVATTLYMSKVDDENAAQIQELATLDPSIYTMNEVMLLAKYFGNINPNMEDDEISVKDLISYIAEEDFSNGSDIKKLEAELIENRKYLRGKVRNVLPFIQNRIENLYSNMLTP